MAFLFLAVLGGQRERTYVVTALLTLALMELLVSGVLKPLIARLRPCHVLEGVRLLGGCTKSFAMPSGHAANSFAQAMVLGLFYRPSFLFSLPLVVLVALSRVTDGKHYPSDVLVGMVLGILGALIIVHAFRPKLEAAGRRLSRKFSLADRVANLETVEAGRPALVFWLILGIATALRLWYVGWADLTPEEATIWDQARHLIGWEWLSATPAEALAGAGTMLLGNTELGVRLGALIVSLLTSVLLWIWAAKVFPWSRWAGPLAGTGLLAAPAFGIGGAHLIDVTLSLLFWTGALAAAELSASGSETRGIWPWIFWGICVGLAIRTEPSGALLVPLTGLFLILSPGGRRWLSRPAPYFGLVLAAALGAYSWAAGTEAWAGAFGGANAEGVLGVLKWHLINLGPLLLGFLLWGLIWALRPALRERREEYLHLVCFSLILAAALFVLNWAGGAHPKWAAAVWIPAWMATVGAVTEIVRRGNRQSLRLVKVLGLVLMLGFVQTAVLLNIRLLAKLDVKTFPKADPAAQIIGWQRLGERVGQSLREMGRETLLLTTNRGTAAELSFYTRAGGPRIQVVNSNAPPLRLPGSLKGRKALLVIVGEWMEPPKSLRPVFRSWQREDLFRVERRKSGVIRSVTLFRLHGYTGPPSSA
ncbi:MAG: phosphatase PAP2 family protein, partial [bacterium]